MEGSTATTASQNPVVFVSLRPWTDYRDVFGGWVAPAHHVAFVAAMLEDQLGTLSRALAGFSLFVFADHDGVANVAARCGAKPLMLHKEEASTIAKLAGLAMVEHGTRCILFQADMPFMRDQDLHCLIGAAQSDEVIAVLDHSMQFFNVLVFRLSSAMQDVVVRAGISSQLASMRLRGVVPQVVQLPSLTNDIRVARDLSCDRALEETSHSKRRVVPFVQDAVRAWYSTPMW